LNYAIPLAQITRIWAPDHIINQLTGPFNDYSTFAEVPRLMRAAPDATTYAASALYLWWSDPQQDAGEDRVLCPSRQKMVWTIMHVALRLETTSTSPELADVLPSEMWMLIMTFVKHEQPFVKHAATGAGCSGPSATNLQPTQESYILTPEEEAALSLAAALSYSY
jgi:hypothetical protein